MIAAAEMLQEDDAAAESDSMLLSMIITQPHLTSELLQHLRARCIARLLGTSNAVATEVKELLPLILRERGRVPETPRSLKILDRAEHALFYDDFSSMDQWTLGPSKPPHNRPSYRKIGVETSSSAAAIGTLTVESELALEPGCRVESETDVFVLVRPAKSSPIEWMIKGDLGIDPCYKAPTPPP